jgi:hypothetical protein
MQNNNYLESPLIKERIKKMKKIKKALKPLNEKDMFKYNETCEDVLYSNKNKEKFKNKRNREITDLLGGKELFKKNLIENVSDNEEKPRYPKNKIISKNEEHKEEKGILSDEDIIFSGNNLKDVKAKPKYPIDEGDEKNKVRIADNKNVDDLFNLEKKNPLVKSLGKKEFNNLNNINENSFSIIDPENLNDEKDMKDKKKKQKVKTREETTQTPKLRPPSKKPQNVIFHEIKTIIKKDKKPLNIYDASKQYNVQFHAKGDTPKQIKRITEEEKEESEEDDRK